MKRMALVVIALAGCKTGPQPDDPCVYDSSDIRVDKAGDNTESAGTLQCVNDKGQIFVLWIDDRDGQPDIWFNASKDGGTTWKNSAIRVNQGEDAFHGNIFRPAIACTDTSVFVAWEDDRDGELKNHNIYFQKSTDLGDTWQDDDVAIDNDPTGVGMSEGPFIATANSNVYVAWFDSAYGAYDILMATSPDEGASWGLPVRVDSDQPAGGAYSAWPQVVARSDQTIVYVAWEDARDGSYDIYFNKSDNAGASFGTDIRIDGGDDPGSHNSFSPKLAADGDNIYVAWHDARNANTPEGPRDIYANYSLDGGIDWSSVAVPVEDPTNNKPGFFNSRFPAVVVKGNQALIAWEDARNNGYDIYARQLENGQPSEDEIRLDGGSESAPSDLGAANSLNAHVAASGNNIVVMWADDRSVDNPDDGFSDLYYNFSKDFGTTWNPQDLRLDNVEAGQSFKLDTNLALVGDTIYAAWTDGRSGSSDVYQHTMKMGEEAQYVITSPQPCKEGDPTASVPAE
jgi:hypothetical protein